MKEECEILLGCQLQTHNFCKQFHAAPPLASNTGLGMCRKEAQQLLHNPDAGTNLSNKPKTELYQPHSQSSLLG